MASFADAFSGENIQRIMADPRVQLGMQLLAAGGPQQGNPSGGQRLAQAAQGFGQQQHQAQLQQMRGMQMQQAQRQQSQMEQLQSQMASPEILQQLSPTARQLAQGGAPADQVWKIHELESQIAARQQQLGDMQSHRGATLAEQQRLNDARIQKLQRAPQGSGAQQPRQPAKRQVLEEPLPDGRIQKHIWDETTNTYRPYGSPYARSAGKGSSDPLAELLGELPTGEPVPGLPGAAPLAQQMPQPLPQGADLLMSHGQPQQARPMVGAGSVPGQQQQPASGGPATPKTKAEYDRLPVGAQYIDPNTGRVATKRN